MENTYCSPVTLHGVMHLYRKKCVELVCYPDEHEFRTTLVANEIIEERENCITKTNLA
jgi:hypothetical protein